MTKLVIVRGLSGSGKSTWAESQFGFVVVSRDALRVALFGSDGPEYYKRADLRACEDLITKVEHGAIEAALRAGKNVISDNTYIEWKYVKPIAAIGFKLGIEVEVKVFDVPLATAIERNKMRASFGGRNVPEDVIRKQHERFQQTKKVKLTRPVKQEVIPYEGTPGKPKAFLVDIDGTLAHMRDYRGPFDWAKVGLDDVDEVIADIVRTLRDGMELGHGGNVIVMSGRDESCRLQTGVWLAQHNIPFDHLFMRPEGDMRKDNIVKHELFNEHVRDNFDVQFVLDDRDQVVEMWRAMGIKCLQVEPGPF